MLGGHFRCFDQFHIPARHQPFDVHENDHMVVHRSQAQLILGTRTGAKFGRRVDLIGFQRDHIGDTIWHYAHQAVHDVKYYHYSSRVISYVSKFKFDAHIHDRDDDAAQIDDIHKIGIRSFRSRTAVTQ